MPIDLVPLLVSAAIRALGLGMVAFAGLWLFRIRSSAARHAAWTVVLAGMLLQIPLEMVAPTIPIDALPTLPVPVHPRVMESPRIALSAAHAAPVSHMRIDPRRRRVSMSWSAMVTGVYLAISMLLFLRMALASFRLRRILRDAKPIPTLGPDVFESTAFVVPGSVGCLPARIFLPGAWTTWDAVKLQAVLAHERAHVRRGDWLIRVVSHVNVCVFWFHPLAWWIERELARLAEDACDDIALAAMENNEEYAATLIDIARAAAANRRVLNWQIVSMAKDSNVTRRVNRIFESRVQVAKPMGRLTWFALVVCSLPAIYLSAAVTLAPANPRPVALEHASVPTPPAPPEPPITPVAQVAPGQPVMPAPPLAPAPHEDPPITICILVDNSGSMRNKREGVKAAALALLKATKPGDEVCIVDFNDEVFNGIPNGKDFTGDMKEMEEALTRIDSRGGSAMREAVRISIEQSEKEAHNTRKVLVLVTDGDDNASTITQEELLNEIRNSGVRVYSIALLNGDDPGRAEAARLALEELADASGGKVYYPRDLAEVESITPEIAHEIRKQ